MKKLLVMGALASVMVMNTACEPEEIAAGAIGVAIGVGLSNGNDNRHPPTHRPPPPVRPAPPIRPAPPVRPTPPPPPYNGGRNDNRGPGFGRDDNRGPGNGRNDNRGPGRFSDDRRRTSVATVKLDNVQNFALRHGISNAQANQISKAFEGAQTQGLAAFTNIGLSQKDLTNIVRRKMPAQTSLAAVAGRLNMSDAQARDLLKFMIADFDEVASDINSDYWKSCMAKGKWKTQLTTFCSSTITQGCAPKSGALYCYN